MIKKRTVFVVGAGASAELGFPLGGRLLAEIGKSLSFAYSADGQHARGWTPKNGDLWEQIQRYAAAKEDVGKYISACQRVNAAAVLGRSIDNIIHQHNDDDAFVFCAKMGIAYEIIKPVYPLDACSTKWHMMSHEQEPLRIA